MRILFLTRLFWPHVGGVEKHVENLSEKLIQKGHQITVLTEKYDNKLKSEEIRNDVKIFRFKYPHKKLIGLLSIWIWIYRHRDLIEKSDIIHCHDVFIWYLPFRFLYPTKKVFTTFHGWEQIYPIPVINILFKKLAWKFSDGTIAVGKFIEKYYGVKANVITYGAMNILEKSFNKDKRKVVYVGRLEVDTGLPIFLKALNNLRSVNLKVLFCGDGSLKNQCARYGKVLGFVDPSIYLANAEICFASGYLTILEAMANKCLVFTAYDNSLKKDYFQLTPFREVINSFDNSQELAKKISLLLISSEEAKNQIEKGYNWANLQTWEKLTNQYLKLWKVGITH